jgi:predicted Zn-dependent peptidase
MKKTLMALGTMAMLGSTANAQKVAFEEFDLDNGLHVVLHQDNSAPVIITSVMYHVGAKDEQPNRTGFAHFFEHLLFEGTKNIERGEWFKIVTANGGQNNANTSDDRTYYYEVFPSNNLELAIWMESERLMHPVINPIGEMEHLDSATLEEFQAFNKKFYVPNNAVLVVAGQFDNAQAKEWIKKYFGAIPKGAPVQRQKFEEAPITATINATWEDPNVQLPMTLAAYRTPSMKTKDARVLDMISSYLSDGKSSKLYKKMVDEKKVALQVGAFSNSQEDYGQYIIYSLPLGDVTSESLLKEIDEEIVIMQNNLISENDFQKLQNKFENNYVSSNSTVEGIAENLASYYLLYGDINLVNTEIEIYRSITREDIKEVAKKYLNPNQRLILNYGPAKEKTAK